MYQLCCVNLQPLTSLKLCAHHPAPTSEIIASRFFPRICTPGITTSARHFYSDSDIGADRWFAPQLDHHSFQGPAYSHIHRKCWHTVCPSQSIRHRNRFTWIRVATPSYNKLLVIIKAVMASGSDGKLLRTLRSLSGRLISPSQLSTHSRLLDTVITHW